MKESLSWTVPFGRGERGLRALQQPVGSFTDFHLKEFVGIAEKVTIPLDHNNSVMDLIFSAPFKPLG
ncbi:MAG: hypothetical protein WCP41_01465 [Verrucomicrobiota bacterium]